MAKLTPFGLAPPARVEIGGNPSSSLAARESSQIEPLAKRPLTYPTELGGIMGMRGLMALAAVVIAREFPVSERLSPKTYIRLKPAACAEGGSTATRAKDSVLDSQVRFTRTNTCRRSILDFLQDYGKEITIFFSSFVARRKT
jgi:hypothetical protein